MAVLRAAAQKQHPDGSVFEESNYFREEIQADFMKFAFQNKHAFEESKRPEMLTEAQLEELELLPKGLELPASGQACDSHQQKK